MFIFYDTETSSRDFLGQVLSYSFVVTDASYHIKDELNGLIKLNRTQIPDPEAIRVNQLNLDDLQKNGKPEYEAAEEIFKFLNRYAQQPHGATLVGFNSNQFDLHFIRNMLIRYGLNPYFKGKIKNLDVLHFSRYLALKNPDTFPWQPDETEEFYSFRLEKLAKAFSILEAPQTHDAKEDVLLTIKLVQALEAKFGEKLSQFDPFKAFFDASYQGQNLGKQRILPTPNSEEKSPIIVWLPFLKEGKNYLMVNLTEYEKDPEATPSTYIKYLNQNKHFFHLEPLENHEEMAMQSVAASALSKVEPLGIISLNAYFRLMPKDWDIEYQIHEMGFERIDILRMLITGLIKTPTGYDKTIETLVARWNATDKTSEAYLKDKYLIQLYNRAYLNLHPNPDPKHLCRYLSPRYLTGTLYRDPKDFVPFEENQKKVATWLETATGHDLEILTVLQQFYAKCSYLFEKC